VPAAPVRITFPFFAVRPAGRALLAGSRRPGLGRRRVSFDPVLSVREPSRPIVGNAGFVTNTGSHAITVFDKHLGQAVAAIGGCGGPAGMALDSGRRRLYVACSADDEIQSIDMATGKWSSAPASLSAIDHASWPWRRTVSRCCRSTSGPAAFACSRPDRCAAGQDPCRQRPGLGDVRRVREPCVRLQYAGVLHLGHRHRRRTVTATVSTDAAPTRGLLGRRGDRLYVIHERSPYLTVLTRDSCRS